MRDYKKLLKPFIEVRSTSMLLRSPYYKNGKICATDRYIAAIITDENSAKFPVGDDYPNLEAVTQPDGNSITVNVDFLYKIAKFYKDLNKGSKNSELQITIQADNMPIKFEQVETKSVCLLMPIIKPN